ncbi:MAG: tetratricopeptide repeat protein [Akkermansiaceae bacterium]|jgi:tetratricopeptide (TPR) repeat protein|nr:tetratricopeptide repeat protein [Akkermansiaceae bacterium]
MKFFNFKFSVFYFLLVAVAGAAEPLPLSNDYWKDETFLKSFNGSYRINARIEPNVTTEEIDLLVSIKELMADGKRKEALRKLEASALVKSSAAVAFNAGNIQFELGGLKQAADYYQSALKISPSFRRAHRGLGFVYVRENDWDKALVSLSEAIRLGDQDGSTYGQLAYGRMHKDQYASALQAFRLAQITQPENIHWKAGVAQCLQHLKRNEEALALLDEVIAVRPREVSYYLLQSSIHLAMDRQDEAITNLDLVRRMGQLNAENHLLLANLHLRAGNNRLARPLLMEALGMQVKPPLVSTLNTLEFITQTRDWKLARNFALTTDKEYERVKGKLEQKQRRLTALIKIESGDDPEVGAATLERLVKTDPLDADSLFLLGRYRASEKRYEFAEMLFQQAQRIDGHKYNVSLELAKLYVATSRYSDALKQLDTALNIRQSDAIQRYRQAVANLEEAAR